MRHLDLILFAGAALVFLFTPPVRAEADSDRQTGFVCAALVPCGPAPKFEVLEAFASDAACGGPKGVYTLRCSNLRLTYENTRLKERMKHEARRDRRRKPHSR